MKKFLSLLFIPQPKNNHRAMLLQPGVLAILICIYILNQSLVRSLTIIKPGILGYSSEITASKVIELTNIERQKLNLPPLRYNSKLSYSATLKAQNMFKEDYWAHNSPSGKTPWDFFRTAGYNYSVAGENLAKDFADTDSMVRAWMNSPSHRANMVNPKYQEIGVGVMNGVLNGVKTTLVVQHFGAPLNGTLANDPLPADYNTNSSRVLAVQESNSISPLMLNKIIGGIIAGLILMVLFVDAYITLKNQTPRITGSTTGHIGFLVIIFLLLILGHSGTIF